MKTYCVTGGAGFIGSHVCRRLLEEGHRVINIDNFSEFYDYRLKVANVLRGAGLSAGFDWKDREQDLRRLETMVNERQYRLCIADIRDPHALDALFQSEQVDGIIHLAALAGVRPSIENPLLYEEVNVRGTMNLLEAMRRHGIRKWVCASSSSVYGNHPDSPCSESEAVDKPISPYAATKKACEEMGFTYHHLYGIDVAMLRFFTVYGPGQRPDLAINKFIRLIESGDEVTLYGDGSTSRDYTYIDDTVNGIIRALAYVEQHEQVYEIVNLGTGGTVSLHTMVKTIEEGLGKRARLKAMPEQVGDVNHTMANIAKAAELFGYAPKISFADGIRKYINWYRGVMQ
ncbi:NAD-dependent epimerase/dehydratase family protein [Paenibacillus sp. NFR01]|uniref:NAD-dependent epimerase/dehydratase family protein n=1 Tax=Paenibacillus sp. NFR01 TaxID=1566279 RepID=UPI0008D31CC0|nr:NAD-dependent epimerase/dehydratase family protein [Paenibacillus sp. NFR01]SET20239.1 Nucleoside-diphosphate-sugar epimerase [Paenibacillus sp. NFR01]